MVQIHGQNDEIINKFEVILAEKFENVIRLCPMRRIFFATVGQCWLTFKTYLKLIDEYKEQKGKYKNFIALILLNLSFIKISKQDRMMNDMKSKYIY